MKRPFNSILVLILGINISLWGATNLADLFNGAAKKRIYHLTNEPIDVVIPAVEKDLETLEYAIEGIKKYGESIRQVYVISPKKLTDKAIWIDEKIFPFQLKDVAEAILKRSITDEEIPYKTGWYLQQLLKLYSPLIIPNISSNVLLLDSDTIFLKPVSFMNEKNEPLFSIGYEHYKIYFHHAKRLLPGFNRVTGSSGIAHHMLIQRDIIEHLFYDIETHHQIPAWQAFFKTVNLNRDGITMPKAGLSEYEIYFNYVFGTSNQGHIRPLWWKNCKKLRHVRMFQERGLDYVSCHSYFRT